MAVVKSSAAGYLLTLFAYPCGHLRGRFGSHQIAEHIDVQDDHRTKSGGGRKGSRFGAFRSTPPQSANRRRMHSARFARLRGLPAKVERRISRASSSIDRPWWAARTLSRALVRSSSWRMVMVATLSMLALLARNAS